MLVVSVLFSVISLYSLLTLKNFFIDSSRKILEEQASHNLANEVKNYAKIIETNLNIKEKMCHSTVNFLQKTKEPHMYIQNIYTVMSKDLNIRGIALLDKNFSILYAYPKNITLDDAITQIKAGNYKQYSKNSYFVDFYLNRDKNAYFAFFYPFKNDSYILFEIDPVGIFSILKSAQIKPMSDKYLWMTNHKGV